MIRAVFTLLFQPFVFSQTYPVLDFPKEPPLGQPLVPPEPKRKLAKPPLQLFNELVSGAPEARLRSLRGLFGADIEDYEADYIDSAQIRSSQLDDDSESEFMIILHITSPPRTRILIADSEGKEWYAVGVFEYWYFWSAEQAEKIAEVSLPLILVRDSWGGTGLSGMTARVYRLWKGQLYNTFEIDEWSKVFTHGSHPPETTHIKREIELREIEVEKFLYSKAIRVNTDEKHTFADVDTGKTLRPPIVKQTCEGYQWLPQPFAFRVTQTATKALCDEGASGVVPK